MYIESCDLYGNSTGGIILNGGVTHSHNVYIRNCNISGYSSIASAITFIGTLTNVAVTNCAGYNDLGHVIASLVSAFPGVGVSFNGVYFGYYGPTALYVTGSGNVSIDGNNTHLASGSFTLGIGESASIATSAPTNFLFVGR